MHKKQKVMNWTNYPVVEADVSNFNFQGDVENIIKQPASIIARGNGRSYGDASLGENIVSSLEYNNILSFDTQKGLLSCQSGILLSDLLDIIIPKGWFLPVTPGTKFITIGGAIASNVHGKNHHKEGAFSNHVLTMELLRPTGEIVTISKHAQKELFELTCGGMGLTGVILAATIQLKKIETSYITFRSIKANNLEEAFLLFEENKGYTYSMAWIDCLQKGKSIGRSIVMLGEHASIDEIGTKRTALSSRNSTLFKMPFNFPGWVLNPFTITLFNFLYYHKQITRTVNKIVHYDGFFYPLDSILDWNKMYGKKGFVQYQLVFPLKKSREGLEEVLLNIQKSGFGSFLGVLKLFGKEDNMISFPMEGYTLALDFPIKKGLFQFLDRLDEIVLKHEGRLYLSKDARMPKDMFWKSYKDADKISNELKKMDPGGKMSSFLADRLNIH